MAARRQGWTPVEREKIAPSKELEVAFLLNQNGTGPGRRI
jgi:hypothetical protein